MRPRTSRVFASPLSLLLGLVALLACGVEAPVGAPAAPRGKADESAAPTAPDAPCRALGTTLTLSGSIPRIDPPRLEGTPLIVTHPTAHFDRCEDARPGIRTLVRDWARGEVVYLFVDEPDRLYLEGLPADLCLRSEGGEYAARFETDEIVLAGGFLGYDFGGNARGCLTATIADSVINHAASRPGRRLTIHLPGDAIYYYRDEDGGCEEDYPALQIRPSRWRHLLLNPFDAFYQPGTTIGPGALPPVEDGQAYHWPPPDGHRRSGHVNDLRLENYVVRLYFDGQQRARWPEASADDPPREVLIKVWSSVETLKQALRGAR